MNNFVINIDESSELDFSIDINASRSNRITQENIEVRFVIENKGITHSFKAERKSNLYTVELPKLDSIVSEGEMPCRLEVICNDRYFIPWQSKVSLERSYKVDAVLESKQHTTSIKADLVPNVRRVKSKQNPNRKTQITEQKRPTKNNRKRVVKPKPKRIKKTNPEKKILDILKSGTR